MFMIIPNSDSGLVNRLLLKKTKQITPEKKEIGKMQINKIVCCIDFSDSSDNALKNAVAMAELHGATLDLIHVREPIVNPLTTLGEGGLSPESIQATLDGLRERMANDYQEIMASEIGGTLVVREGHVSTEIVDYLKESQADLAVLGSKGLSGMGLVFFGSVSRRVAQKAPCNVFVSRRRKTTAK